MAGRIHDLAGRGPVQGLTWRPIGAEPRAKAPVAGRVGLGPAGARAPELGLLSPEARAQHVLDTIRAGLGPIAERNPDGARAKLEALGESPFRFFRGTAALFYSDLERTDQGLPRVLLNGDVHPENFGVLQRNDGKLVFALDDFDEAHPGPFSWDVKRGAVGFELAARQLDLKKGARKDVVHAFVDGYTDALKRIAAGKPDDPLTAKDSPKMVRKLLAKAAKETRAELLEERVDVAAGKFLDTDEIEPRPDLVGTIQAALVAYRETLVEAPGCPNFLRVKDVADKTGSGTGSLGRPRYYALIEGHGGDGADDLILELKAQGGSALAPYVGVDRLGIRGDAARVFDAQRVQVEGGVRLYGHTEVDGEDYLVRERSPHKKRFDVQDLDADELEDYARIAGAILAHAHSPGEGGKRSPAKAILRSVKTKTFEKETESFARKMADRVETDHAHFVEAMADDPRP